MVHRETSQNGSARAVARALRRAALCQSFTLRLSSGYGGNGLPCGTLSPQRDCTLSPGRPLRPSSQAFLVETLAMRIFWVRWPEGLVSRRSFGHGHFQ